VFGFVNAANAVQNALNNALIATAARFKVDDILTRDRIGFQDAVGRRVRQIIETQKLGVIVEQCIVQSRPPGQLAEAFRNVVRAEVNRSKLLYEARSYENQTTNRANADASAAISIAESDRTRMVKSIAADATRFTGLLSKYERNPICSATADGANDEPGAHQCVRENLFAGARRWKIARTAITFESRTAKAQKRRG
jgi:membrane protease subunit HflK